MATKIYYTVVIPYTDKDPTIWHPVASEGPWSKLTRGAFDSEDEAHRWAATHIPGHSYTIEPHPWFDDDF